MPGRPISPEALYLLANMHAGLDEMPKDLKQNILRHLNVARSASLSLTTQILSSLGYVSGKTIQNSVRPILAGKKQLMPLQSGKKSERDQIHTQPVNNREVPADAREHLMNTIRTAVRHVVLGRPFEQLTGDLYTASLAGAQYGTTHHGKNLGREVLHVGLKVLHESLRKKLALELPGLGIPSDLEILADSGSGDKHQGRERHTLLLVGVILSTKRGSESMLLECHDEEADCRGDAQVTGLHFFLLLDRGLTASSLPFEQIYVSSHFSTFMCLQRVNMSFA